jgi:hypothetical protein
MEVCVILTRTSPGFGGATRISSTDKGSPALYATAATQNTMISPIHFSEHKKKPNNNNLKAATAAAEI